MDVDVEPPVEQPSDSASFTDDLVYELLQAPRFGVAPLPFDDDPFEGIPLYEPTASDEPPPPNGASLIQLPALPNLFSLRPGQVPPNTGTFFT